MTLFLDTDKSLGFAGPVVVRVGESGSKVSAVIADKGSPISLDGRVVTFRALHRGEDVSAPCDVSGPVATWTMPTARTTAAFAPAYVEVASGESVVTTQDISITVRR